MIKFAKQTDLLRRIKASAFCGILCAAIFIPSANAQLAEPDFAQTAATTVPPYALFQYSTLVGADNTVTATWVPVTNSSGKTIYQNVTLLFDIDSSGNLTIAPGYPKFVPSPMPLVTSFAAGRYVGPASTETTTFAITVSSLGVAPGGATEWSLAAAKGAYTYTYPSSGTWYAGPIASNPLASRLKAAGITSTAWSYGVGGSCNCTLGNGGWYKTNALLGFSQTGNQLNIVSFTDDTGKDYSEPVSQITYTLAP